MSSSRAGADEGESDGEQQHLSPLSPTSPRRVAAGVDELKKRLHRTNVLEWRLSMLSRQLMITAWHREACGIAGLQRRTQHEQSMLQYLRVAAVRHFCLLPFVEWARWCDHQASARLREEMGQIADDEHLAKVKGSRLRRLVKHTLKVDFSLDILKSRFLLIDAFRRWRDGVEDSIAYRTALRIRIRSWLGRWWHVAHLRRQYGPMPARALRLHDLERALRALSQNRQRRARGIAWSRCRRLVGAIRRWKRQLIRGENLALTAQVVRSSDRLRNGFRQWQRSLRFTQQRLLRNANIRTRQTSLRTWARAAQRVVEILRTPVSEHVVGMSNSILSAEHGTRISANGGAAPVDDSGTEQEHFSAIHSQAAALVASLSALGGYVFNEGRALQIAAVALERTKRELEYLQAQRQAETSNAESAASRAQTMLSQVRDAQDRVLEKRRALERCEAQQLCMRHETIICCRGQEAPQTFRKAPLADSVLSEWLDPLLAIDERLLELNSCARQTHRRLKQLHSVRPANTKMDMIASSHKSAKMPLWP